MLLKNLNNLNNLSQSLVFRLTLLYSGIFTSIIILVFFLYYIFNRPLFPSAMDKDLLYQAEELPAAINGLDKKRIQDVLKVIGGGSRKVFCRVIEPGSEIFISNKYSSKDIPINETLLKCLSSDKKNIFETISISAKRDMVRSIYAWVASDRTIQIGRLMTEPEWLWGIFGRALFGTGIVILIFCSWGLGYFMAKRALEGVKEVTQTAMFICNGEYDKRVPIAGRGKEIDALATAFNKMLEQIQTLIHEMEEMTDNIAHDLRSPVTRIRGIAEMTIMTGKRISDYELMAEVIIEDCDRLLGIINMMLDISEAEAGISKLNKSKVNPLKLVKDACELFQTIADDKWIKINTDYRSCSNIYVDEKKLQRVVANLLDNAVKYSPTGGEVKVSIFEDGAAVKISISDDGVGISQKDLPYIFKRFYRCDSSRSKAGVGLGLSWAQAIIKTHGGNILVHSKPDEGSTFIINLPNVTV
jgi:signal transduction histidine kinase